MLEKQAKEILRTRREVDPELRDWIGREDDFVTFYAEVDLDTDIPDRLIRSVDSVAGLETAFDTSELLQKLAGMDRAEADDVAYAPLQKAAQERRQKQIDNSPHREVVSQIIANTFGNDLGLAKRSRESRLALVDSMTAFVENAVQDARIAAEIGG